MYSVRTASYGKMRQIRIIPFYGEDLYDYEQDQEGTKKGKVWIRNRTRTCLIDKEKFQDRKDDRVSFCQIRAEP